MDEDAPSGSVSKKKGEKKRNKNIVRPGTKPKQDIKSMFAAAAATGGAKKKSEKDVSLANDDILDGLMGELNSSAPSGKPTVKLGAPSQKQKKPAAYNPFKVETKLPARPKANKTPQGKSIKRELSYSSSPSVAPLDSKTDRSTKSGAETQVTVKEEPEDEVMQDDDDDDVLQAADESVVEEDMDAGVGADSVDLSGIDFDEEVEEVQKPSAKPASVSERATKPLISDEMLSVGWENVSEETADGQAGPGTGVTVDSSSLPMVTNSAGESVIRFYWFDAYEDSYNQPGVVYLFGKVYVESAQTYVSCCVTVKNIERRLYLLPRLKRMNLKHNVELEEDVTMPMVYEEFDKVAEKNRILKFKSMKVKRFYAFDKLDVPVEAEYLEVRYSADLPTLPSDLQGETFSHVFGTKTSSLELLLLNRKMKGPAWLDLKCPQMPKPPTSWCKLEAMVLKPEHVSVSDVTLPPPPLTVMTLNLRTLPNPKTRQNEIVAAACLVHTDFHMDRPAPKQFFQQHFCVISKPDDCIFPFDFRDQVKKQASRMKVEIMPSERGLIACLLAKIQKADPDLLVGHDIYGFDLDLLLHRITVNKIPHWSRISRLKRTRMPKITHNHGRATFAEKSAVCGRMMCDVQISARELIRCRSYDLTELSSQVLKHARAEVDYDKVREMYSSSKQLLQLVELTLMDSTLTLRIMYELNVIPLALQITKVCGNVMSRTLMGGRSERNEWLLLHAFLEKQYICPDKEFKKKQVAAVVGDDEDEVDQSTSKAGQGKRKPAYAGGLVLEPKKGFYDTYILLLDFNSLYPSIIQEYNICFTTISRTEAAAQSEDPDEEVELILPDSDLEPGVLPTEIRKLVDSRKQVKNLMKGSDVSADQMMQYDIRQKALKLTANSMYGCLGFSFSRFYAKQLAALVTGKGREILMKTKDLVQGMNLDVIYGDTDSIMINTNSTDFDQVFKLGNKVKSEVNKLYRLLEIDIDGVFQSMLLLKKKKYAALSISRGPDGKVTSSQELKGLDIVRRDWCDLAKEAGKYVVDQILSGKNRETILENIHAKLTTVGEDVTAGKVAQTLFYISKQLTKNPEDYPDKKSLPHVQVAMRYNSKGGKKMRAGDTVPYIICEDGSTLSATQRAYHPEELSRQDNLKIDTKYYLAHQIHPVVCRLCDPIEGTDSARIAECLGLDPSGYRQVLRQNEGEEEEDLVTMQLTMEERFRDCDRFTFPCPAPGCGRQIVMDSAFTGHDSSVSPTLQACPNPDCNHPLWKAKNQLKNLLQLKIQKHINRYYQGWLKCDDSVCGSRTNKVPLIMQRGRPVCAACDRGFLQPEYTDSVLYTQLCFYDYMFDVQKASLYMTDAEKATTRKLNPGLLDAYRDLRQLTSAWLSRSAYSNVDLGRLFHGLGLTTQVKVKQEREI
ncbi:DNA polymerase alpha catalytic subunit isoform X2 [Aplysia californica]|nr:DNA polymerase alpha catalytic subunit isoform X2 [Aplysia californica]